MVVTHNRVDQQKILVKKRKKIRSNEVVNYPRLSSFCTGDDCECSILKCFQEVPEEGRRWIIRNFNELRSHDEQYTWLD